MMRNKKAFEDGPLMRIMSGGMGPPPSGHAHRTKDYTPITWEEYFETKEIVHIPDSGNKFCVYQAGKHGAVYVLLHGAGHSALSWALTAALLKDKCRVLAFDCRGHGESHCTDDADLAAETLVNDAIHIIDTVLGPDPPPVVLAGHSMGGAIAARVAATGRVPSLRGLVVIDVVEGTALASLRFMHNLLNNRPARFDTLPKAIEWSVRSGTIKNAASARVSFPSQLSPTPDGHYTWRIDLAATEQYWQGWFQDLSSIFLAVPAAKLLVLAGTDRLDRPLTIAQMQGKFQLSLLYGVGHTIQEDDPAKLAEVLIEFLTRNRITTPPDGPS